jgi:hypothetical protein
MKHLFLAACFHLGLFLYRWHKLFVEPTLLWLLGYVDEFLFLRNVKFGAACRYVDGGTKFWGRSPKARAVVDKVCRRRFHRVLLGGYFVPERYHQEVYERIMHDPYHPQCMTMEVKFLGGALVTDTP